VITDDEFYADNIYKWLPDPKKGYEEQKKMLGFSIENEGFEMIALGPKCYSLRTEKRDIMKVKGVILKQNPHISHQSYRDVLTSGNPMNGENIMLRIRAEKGKDFEMTKQLQPKIALTAIHNKMRVLSNNSCAPFIEN
jgi:hypothetical protein